MISSTTLFHFSEDPTITKFVPRSVSTDGESMVWGIDAEHAPNYYFPRDCPRVCFAIGANSTPDDIERLLGLTTAKRVIAIEAEWFDRVRMARLYRYYL